MIREIMRDTAFLAQRAEPATQADLSVAEDLLETLEAHKDGCVGMAANMIGVTSASSPLTTRAATWSCSTRSSSKNRSLLRRRRAACLSPARERRSAGNPSRCNIKMSASRPASRPSPAGRPRSSSTKSTTARESLFKGGGSGL